MGKGIKIVLDVKKVVKDLNDGNSQTNSFQTFPLEIVQVRKQGNANPSVVEEVNKVND